MRLRSIQIKPSGMAGWSSEELFFGAHITELFGPNGCGKTPLIQSISFALGYPVKFRDDVLDKCEAVILNLDTDAGPVELRRKIDSSFDVSVTTTKDTYTYFAEKEYSKFLLELFGFGVPTLTTTGNDPTAPYMATLLPIFYLDQDLGYTSAYRPPSTFIKDQYAEMMRLIFGLAPKHSFDQKKTIIAKKRRLEQVDRLIVRKRDLIETLTEELGRTRRDPRAVNADMEDVRQALERLKNSRSLKNDAQLVMDSAIYTKQAVQRTLLNEITELQSRINGFAKIQEEIEMEINTLSLNEEARRLFTSFQDICSNSACGLFLGSSDSYAKNLLYLRDQIKDLRRNTDHQRVRVAELTAEFDEVVLETNDLEAKRREISEGDEVAVLVEAISKLTGRLIKLEKERQALAELSENERDYIELLNEQEQIQNELGSLSGSATVSDLRAIEIRADWRARLMHWLEVLDTKNVSRDIHIDVDFGIVFGEEKISQFKGSTLLRVVLAIHTATVELYTKNPSKKFRFFILDTPRQQDIDRNALGSYITELKKLAIENTVQIVFSTTDYHYQCTGQDEEWKPTFPGPEQQMFLGSLITSASR